MTTRRYGRYVVEITNPAKDLYPGITKADVVAYYERVASYLLPHLAGRPLTLRRFPDGIAGEGFYQKRAADYFPDWIRRLTVPSAEGDLDQVVCDNRATLIYLANQGTLEFHPWLSRARRLDHPDVAIFDLDPAPGQSFADVRRAAQLLKGLLDELGCRAFARTTGSRGIHVVLPLRPELEFDGLRHLVRLIAETVASRHPDLLTTNVRKASRDGRLFVDVLRNAYAQTAVASYSLRAIEGAPVAMPVPWDAFDADFDARAVQLANIERWLNLPDPWAGIWRKGQSLQARRDPIERLHREATTGHLDHRRRNT